MKHECLHCGAEEPWIDDGGPPDGWVFLERHVAPVCGACLDSLGLGPNAREIVCRVSRVRQDPGVLSVEYLRVPPENEAVYRWLDCEPALDVTGAAVWRWTRQPEDFAALAPVRQALQERSSRLRCDLAST